MTQICLDFNLYRGRKGDVRGERWGGISIFRGTAQVEVGIERDAASVGKVKQEGEWFSPLPFMHVTLNAARSDAADKRR